MCGGRRHRERRHERLSAHWLKSNIDNTTGCLGFEGTIDAFELAAGSRENIEMAEDSFAVRGHVEHALTGRAGRRLNKF